MATQITCDDCYKRLPYGTVPTFALYDMKTDSVIYVMHLCDACITTKKSCGMYVENPYYVGPIEIKEACTGE